MQGLIGKFESKWNERLQALLQQGKRAENDQVTGICKELSQLCQALQQQAAQLQTPLLTVQNRLRTLQLQSSPALPQNGH